MTRHKASLVSLFLLSMTVLAMEVFLTRIFSAISWHHFAYLIISLALLGFGAAGSYLTVSRRFADDRIDPVRLGHFAWLFAISAGAAVIVASKIRFYPVDIQLLGDYSNGISLLLLYVITGAPFFFAGVCIGRLVALAGDRVNQFYFADLLGAGVGALAALAVINSIGAVAGIFLAAAVACATAILLGTAGVKWRRWAYGLSLLALLTMTGLTWQTNVLPLYYPPSKDLFRGENKVRYSKWHVVGKIDIIRPGAHYWSFGGALSRRVTETPPPVRGIYQDGAAPTGIMSLEGPAEGHDILGEYLQGVGYVPRQAESSLIIGVGGGIDALIALHHGVDKVVGVDLNPVTVDAVQNRYRNACPTLWQDGRFEIHVAEGRHFLTRTKDKFDVIQLSGVDTFTALSSGAYALSENFLYTTGAMRDYWARLTDNGILSFSRWLFTPPRETLRLVMTQLEVLEQLDVPQAQQHFIILSGPAFHGLSPWAETLLKRSPFTPEEVDRVIQWAANRKFDVLYDPYHARENEFNEFIKATPQERKELAAAYPFNVNPTTDDDPFFFQFYRWDSLLALAGDKGGLAQSKGGYGITRVPLGLIVLGLSLLQMVLLSGIFIIAPLAMRKRLRTHSPGRFGVFMYFAALGLAFMFIEIALLQKLTVFVGGPVYSMAITLSSILIFSGIGSYIARSFRKSLGRSLIFVIIGICAITFGEVWFLNSVLHRLLGLSQPLRWLVAAGTVMPLAILLGMPFPTGLRVLQRIDESMRPWAWGVNACATVIGSILCVLLSIHAGFTTTLMVATVVYVVGGLGLAYAIGRNRAALSQSG